MNETNTPKKQLRGRLPKAQNSREERLLGIIERLKRKRPVRYVGKIQDADFGAVFTKIRRLRWLEIRVKELEALLEQQRNPQPSLRQARVMESIGSLHKQVTALKKELTEAQSQAAEWKQKYHKVLEIAVERNLITEKEIEP